MGRVLLAAGTQRVAHPSIPQCANMSVLLSYDLLCKEILPSIDLIS